MFEKEAEEYVPNINWHAYSSKEIRENMMACYRKGATDGYNKANEWYYVKDKLPPSGETVLLYFGADIMGKAVMCTGRVDCKGNWYKNVDEEPIKWQEIVLPKPLKESE